MRRILKWIFGGVAVIATAFIGSWLYSMPDSTERGVWQHEADGQILELTRLQARLYHQTSRACLPGLTFPAHMALVKAMEGAWIDATGDRLALHIDGNIAPLLFTRIDNLPEACTTPPDPAPASTFTAMWTAMDEHYAFFDLHGVDWDARRSLAPTPDETMTDADLFDRMATALQGLDDGHIQLIAGDQGFYTPSLAPDWMPDPPLSRAALNTIARDSIAIPMTAVPQTGLQYGLTDSGVGYLLITTMSTDPGFGQLGTNLARQAFEEVATALAEARAVIIDIRYNPGGDDGTALAYAAHFTDTPIVALTKRTRAGDGWTAPVEAVVTPANRQITAPVLLLTSRLTGSGAEIFTMAMRDLPQVTVMGEPTGGGLSDILGITLPNGWQFGLSNQEYRSADGTVYEAIGIPPDIPMDTDGAALARGQDPVLQAAIQWVEALD